MILFDNIFIKLNIFLNLIILYFYYLKVKNNNINAYS